jgi:Cu+-exporting ATPase
MNQKNSTILDISGMTCSSCVLKVEKALKSVDGVKSVAVNFASEKARIVYTDQNIPSINTLLKEIDKAGFKGSIHKSEDQIESETKALKLKLTVGGIISLILVIAMLHEMGIPYLPMWLMNPYFQMFLSTPVVFWVGLDFHIRAYKALKNKTSDMNTLVSLGTLSSYIYSLIVTFFPNSFIENKLELSVYFESASVIIFLVMLGKYFESIAKKKTNSAIKSLLILQPKTANIITTDGFKEINISEVKVNDILLIKAGERVPLDGLVINGHSNIDESMLTGESLPVSKKENSSVIGGTTNKEGTLEIKVTKTEKESTLYQIIEAVEEAQISKAPVQKLADNVTSYFVPTIIILSIITFIIWMIFSNSISMSLINAVSVLVIACPCALGLATPTAIMAGTGKGAEKGILIRNAEALEKFTEINTIIFDKTGTLTEGKPIVTDIYCNSISEKEVLELAYSIELKSQHPLANAVIEKAIELNIESRKTEYFNYFAGKGIEVDIDDKTYFLGNTHLMNHHKINISDDFNNQYQMLSEQGKTVILLSNEKEVLGLIAISDKVKSNAKEIINKLKEDNIEVIMISGDNNKVVANVAKELGINRFYSEVLPIEKSNYVKDIQKENKKVAMVGDGVNDSPALTQADLGISMGSGTQIAIESSDIVIMNSDLKSVLYALFLSKKTMNTIKQNLFWAFIYNSIGIPIASGILYPFYGILLSPVFASFAMGMSSVSVIFNSLKLKKL